AISAVALFSTANSILSNMLGSSRVLRGLSQPRPLLRLLAFVSPRTGTPVVALGLVAAAMAAFSRIDDLRTIALISNFVIFATFTIVNACVITLRLRRPELQRTFRVRGSVRGVPVPPVIACVLLLTLAAYGVHGLVVAGR